MARPKKSGSPAKRKKKLLGRSLTKESFAKSVEIMPDGSRKVALSPDAMEMLELQRKLFRAKFGRDPGPHDPIFFDPEADTPQPMPALEPSAMEALAVEAGIRPELAYAMAKTGVMLAKENEHLYTEEDKAEFQAAVEEYRARASRLDS